MIFVYFIGIVMGLFASIFPGPINLETVRRSISRGPKVGLAFGLGASSADALFALAASYGASYLFAALPNWGKGTLGMISACLIAWVGVNALRAKVKPPPEAPIAVPIDSGPAMAAREDRISRLAKHYGIGVGITITSIPTLMFWLVASVPAAKFAAGRDDFWSAPYFTALGVFTACALWVFGAVTIAGRYHKRLDAKGYLKVERVVGVIMLVIAAISAFKAVELYRGKIKGPDTTAIDEGRKHRKIPGFFQRKKPAPKTAAVARRPATPAIAAGAAMPPGKASPEVQAASSDAGTTASEADQDDGTTDGATGRDDADTTGPDSTPTAASPTPVAATR